MEAALKQEAIARVARLAAAQEAVAALGTQAQLAHAEPCVDTRSMLACTHKFCMLNRCSSTGCLVVCACLCMRANAEARRLQVVDSVVDVFHTSQATPITTYGGSEGTASSVNTGSMVVDATAPAAGQ
ncbi:hypothetical protein EON66_04530 [archaeon]|nr:MAG: hypothetical protein EON66_04530 [archaeon]